MSQDSHDQNIASSFSLWKWIAWTAAILAGIGVANTAVDRHRMEQLRTEVESRGGRLEGSYFVPDWYKWLESKAPSGWPKQAVLKLKGNFQRVVAVRLPPGTVLPHNFISRLTRFRSLAHLELPDCHLSDADLDHLSEFSNLRYLDLRGNLVSDGGLAHLDKLVLLEQVHLPGTRAGDEVLRQAATLPNLRFLNLSRTSVTDAGLQGLRTHLKLRYLVLDGTQISDSGLASLLPQPSLVNLTLNHCAITDKGLAAIDDSRFPALGQLEVRKTQVTADGISRLRLSHLRDYQFPNASLTDEHWLALARMKSLVWVHWGEIHLRREFERSSSRRRIALDSFVVIYDGHIGEPQRLRVPLPRRFPQSSVSEFQ